LGGEGGPEVTLPGSDDSGEPALGEGGASPGAAGPSSVPYTQVFPEYAQAYRQAINSGLVPPALRPLVRDYFSSLEP
jgi:hypothetical protein